MKESDIFCATAEQLLEGNESLVDSVKLADHDCYLAALNMYHNLHELVCPSFRFATNLLLKEVASTLQIIFIAISTIRISPKPTSTGCTAISTTVLRRCASLFYVKLILVCTHSARSEPMTPENKV